MHARPFGRRITNRLIVGVLLLHSVATGCGGTVEGRRNAEAVAVPENALIVSPSEDTIAAAEKRDLTPAQKRLVAEWRKAHEHAKVFYAAVARKSKENTEKLVAFRKANGFPLYHWNEQ